MRIDEKGKGEKMGKTGIRREGRKGMADKREEGRNKFF